MLEDRPRTLAYKTAIETNDAVKNKIVLGKDEIYEIKLIRYDFQIKI